MTALSSSLFHSQVLTFLQDSHSQTVSFQLIYQKNISMLRESLSLSTEIPDTTEIQAFLQTIKPHSQKSFIKTSKIYLIWLLSIYETLTGNSMENLVFFLWFQHGLNSLISHLKIGK